MEVSVGIVRQHCGRYFESYAACVDKFPHTWPLDCEKQKLKLNKCAEGHPTILNIKHGCKEQYERYEECIHKHPADYKQCRETLSVFKKCAQKYYTPEDLQLASKKEGMS